MKTITVPLEMQDVEHLQDRQLRQALIEVGMWDESNEHDPTIGHAAAWELVRRMSRRIGQGVVLSVAVSHAFNGYGRVEYWTAIYQEYAETCERCEVDPDHKGRHAWRREWISKLSGEGFTAELAVCRLALRYALGVQEYGG